jgi:hypothetical protein
VRAFDVCRRSRLRQAETAGREAIRRDPTDLWAAHGVAHVLEMTGRRREGLAWVDALQDGWSAANNLKHHFVVAPDHVPS